MRVTPRTSGAGQTFPSEAVISTGQRLAVPMLGDLCAIDLLEEDGQLRRVTHAHADRDKEGLVRGEDLDPNTARSISSSPLIAISSRPCWHELATDRRREEDHGISGARGDEEDARTSLGPLLTTLGYEVEESADGEEAVERTRAYRPAVVIADLVIVMAGTDSGSSRPCTAPYRPQP